MTRRHRLRARSGLTLLELVVALSITGLAMTAGYATLATLMDRRASVDEATRSTAAAYQVRAGLSRWLSAARLDPTLAAPGFCGTAGLHGDQPDDELLFLTTATTPLGDGDAMVRLYIARDATGRARGLAADVNEHHGLRRQTVVLDSSVAALRIRYRAGAFSSVLWQPTWLSATVLPAGVELQLFAAPGDSLPPLLRVPVVVALEGGR
jgi:prepilin-type N-terminal cleavage/methylation domain-containing protein